MSSSTSDTQAGRWLDRNGLATYISVRVSELPRLARRALIPQPSMHLGPRSPRWDRVQVDAMFDGPSAQPPDNVTTVESYIARLRKLGDPTPGPT